MSRRYFCRFCYCYCRCCVPSQRGKQKRRWTTTIIMIAVTIKIMKRRESLDNENGFPAIIAAKYNYQNHNKKHNWKFSTGSPPSSSFSIMSLLLLLAYFSVMVVFHHLARCPQWVACSLSQVGKNKVRGQLICSLFLVRRGMGHRTTCECRMYCTIQYRSF